VTTTSQAGSLGKLLAAEPIIALGRRAETLGVEAHVVGGAVRDYLLGRESHDYDVTVSGRGRELAEGVARDLGARFVPLGGKEFASFRVVAGRREGEGEPAWELDVWDREGGSLEADLARRDFTVNAIAVAVGEGDGALVDPFGGADDLARRRLRATTAESFRDDPLRVLRLPRFLVQLPGFEAETETVALARRSVPGLARVAGERIRDELALILGHERAHRGVAGLLEVGVYPWLWLGRAAAAEKGTAGSGAGKPADDDATREAEPAPGSFSQGATDVVVAGAAGRAGRAVDAVDRLAERAAEVARLAPGAPPVDLPAGRWTLTFAALAPRPDDPPDPAAEPEVLVGRFRDAGYVTRDLAVRVRRLLAEREIPPDERARRRFLHRLGAVWPTAVAVLGAAWLGDGGAGRAAVAARAAETAAGAKPGPLPPGRAASAADRAGERVLADWRRAIRELAALLTADGERILDPPRLLSGEDVQRLLGVPPGPQVGQALDRVRRAQVDGEIATREEADRLLRGG
jgi:hypothetical protein